MSYIDGLLAERDRLLAAGRVGRAAQVDAELVRVGYQPPKKTAARKKSAQVERADEAAPEQAVPSRPRRRPSR